MGNQSCAGITPCMQGILNKDQEVSIPTSNHHNESQRSMILEHKPPLHKRYANSKNSELLMDLGVIGIDKRNKSLSK